jgi:hypothetical protein
LTLTINSGQATLAARPNATLVPIVILETFSNKLTNTVGATYYWTRGGPLRYSWNGGAAVQFDPRLKRITPVDRGFDHLPNATAYATREVLEIVVDATPRAGTYLWKELLALNLIGARVTVGSLLLDPELESTSVPYWDLSALGTVHVVRWRGEVTSISELVDADQVISIVAETREPILGEFRRMLTAQRPRVDDVGKQLPMIVGDVKQVRGLWYRAGSVGTLWAGVNSIVTSWNVSAEVYDLFVSWYGSAVSSFFVYVICEDEIVSLTNPAIQPDGSYTMLVVRGLSGTTAAAHDAGALIYEIPPHLELAISSGGGYGFGGDVVYLPSAGRPTELSRLPIKGCNLQTDYTDSQLGRVCLLQVDNFRRILGAYTPSYGAFVIAYPDAEILADVLGEYSIGSWTTRFVMTGSAGAWAALDIQGFPVAGQTRAPVTGGVQFGYSLVPALGTGYAVATVALAIANTELRFTVNFTAAELANLIYFQVGVNLANVTGSLYFPNEQLVIYAHRLEVGDNEIRMNVRVTPTVTQIVFAPRFKVWGVNASYRVTGVIESAPMTQIPNHPSDVADYVVNTLAASPDLGVDATSFTTSKTDVPFVTINADLATLGQTVGQVLAELGFNGRINYFLAEGATQTVVKASSALTTYAFGAIGKVIGALFTDLRSSPRSIAEIANRFSALYAPLVGEPTNDPEAYSKTLVADEVRNDLVAKVATATITANQTAYGYRESSVVPLTLLNDSVSAVDVMGYYATESLRGQVSRYSAVLPWWIGYDLEPGDIVSIQPRWETAAVKCRVLRVVFDFERNGVGVNLEAVT